MSSSATCAPTRAAPPNVITPPSSQEETIVKHGSGGGSGSARRSLRSTISGASSELPSANPPSSQSGAGSTAAVPATPTTASNDPPNKRRRMLFGGRVGRVVRDNILPPVLRAYSTISRRTGSIGGNGHGGAIYGEITMGSMQKMVDLMKDHTGFDSSSRFIDVGCGLGKPNIHVALDPGVEFSYGCEMEAVRWWLGVNNLDAVLGGTKEGYEGVDMKCMLAHADVAEARTLDPFTHVYMFDIGFPPALFYRLAKMYNRSVTPKYLICYHGPRLMIDEYCFNVELLAQTPTSMHGSSEGHMGYVYQRVERDDEESTSSSDGSVDARERGMVGATACDNGTPCDPLFQGSYEYMLSSTPRERADGVRRILRANVNLAMGQCGVGDGEEATHPTIVTKGEPRKSGRERRRPERFVELN